MTAALRTTVALISAGAVGCTVSFPADAKYRCSNDADCGGDGYVCALGACCDPKVEDCSGGGAGGGSGDCPAGLTRCGSACVSLADRMNCGTCGNACPADWPCEAGACSAPPTSNPFLALVTPASATVGTTAAFTLSGDRFLGGALVRLSGAGLDGERPLVVTDEHSATVSVDLAAARPAMVEVQVVNPGRLVSNTRLIAVSGSSSAQSMLSAAFPSTAPTEYAGSLTVSGSALDARSQLQLSGGSLAAPRLFSTVFVTSSQLYVSSFDLTGIAQGSYALSAVWPGGQTNALAFMVQGSTPAITGISPSRAPKGTMATLTIDGARFDGTSVARLAAAGGAASVLTTTLVGPTRLTAGPIDLTTYAAGNYAVTVRNNGLFDSNAVGFVVQSNEPTLVSVSPAGARQEQTVDLTFAGANLLPGAEVTISSATLPERMLPTTFVDSHTVRVNGLALATYPIGSYQLKLRNPTSNPSASVSFTVTEGTPTLSQVNPSSISVSGTQPSSATLTGTFFYVTSTVHISGGTFTDSALPTTWVSPTQLTVTQSTVGVTPGMYQLWVVNPASPAPLASSMMTVTLTP